RIVAAVDRLVPLARRARRCGRALPQHHSLLPVGCRGNYRGCRIIHRHRLDLRSTGVAERGFGKETLMALSRRMTVLLVAMLTLLVAVPLAAQPKQTPPVVRTPNGTVQDTREYWLAGRALWEPCGIKAPTLIVVGEWDAGTTAVASARAVF